MLYRPCEHPEQGQGERDRDLDRLRAEAPRSGEVDCRFARGIRGTAALSPQKQLSEYTSTGARKLLRISRMAFPAGPMRVHSRHGAPRP